MENDYATMAETESYALKYPWRIDTSAVIVRKCDGHYCYVSDTDAEWLYALLKANQINEFTIVCNGFIYSDPILEKQAYPCEYYLCCGGGKR